MARDYKHARRTTAKKRQPSRRRKQQATPGWVWLLAGLSIGLLVAVAVYIYDRTPQQAKTVKQEPPPAKPEQQTTKKTDEAPPKPRFDFYTILPEQEVIIPERELEQEQQREKKSGHYMLQAGSFRRYQEADSLKAQLAFLGVEAKIQSVTGTGGETWHRVRVGPFDDLRQLNKTRNRLNNNDINTMLLKVRD